MSNAQFQLNAAENGGVMKRKDHLTFRGNVKSGRHGWLRLTPAYSLHVVNEILEDAGSDELILDPFSGTGTTPLACAIHGIESHSVDINPFLVWLGNVKFTRFPDETAEHVQQAAKNIVNGLRRRKNWSGAWMPDIHQIEKWWDEPVLDTLAQLFASIERLAKKNGSYAGPLLKIAFCKTAIETSHASFGHQSMSFKKREESNQQYLFDEDSETEARENVINIFLKASDDIALSVVTDSPTATAKVFQGDSRNLVSALPKRKYTKVITSPPYPNRMSYIRELRPYMYWLGYLETARQAGELDWQAIGGTWGCATSNLGKWSPSEDGGIAYPAFDAIVSAISEDHELLGRYVHKYFEDIKTHLQSLKKVLAPGAQCYYVVGNSKFYGTLLPVEEIYAALFQDVGFVNTRIETLRKRTSKKELYEYVVYAEAPAE